MLIYDKKENSIDIYNMEANEEAIEKYRKAVIQKHKKEPLFYYLKTNNPTTVKDIQTATDIDVRLLSYDNGTVLDCGTYSNLYEVQPANLDEDQEEILEGYITGYYDKLQATRVFEYRWKDEKEAEILRLLKPEKERITSVNSHGNVYQIDDMLNLPRNLYLLHLLLQGKYSRVADENIARLLKLFEFEYQRNIKLTDIEDMLSTGLVSGTLEQAIKKAEVGSKILQKVKNK